MSETALYPWISEALYSLQFRKWTPLNEAAERFADLNDSQWTGWQWLEESPVGPCCLWLAHPDRGQLKAEVLPDQALKLRVLDDQACQPYLAMRDNLLDMVRHEFQSPLQSLLEGFKGLKKPAEGGSWEKSVAQLLRPALHIHRLLPSIIDLAELHGHAQLQGDDRIELGQFIPELIAEYEASALQRGIRIEFSPGEKPLGALYGSTSWLSKALRALMRDVVDNAEENTDIRLVARQMPYMMNLMIRVVGGLGQRGMSKEIQDERPLVPADGKVDPKRVELHLAYAVLKRMGGNFKFKSGGLGVEYIVEIPTGQGRSADTDAQAKLAAQQAEQYAKDMAMLMEAVARRSK